MLIDDGHSASGQSADGHKSRNTLRQTAPVVIPNSALRKAKPAQIPVVAAIDAARSVRNAGGRGGRDGDDPKGR